MSRRPPRPSRGVPFEVAIKGLAAEMTKTGPAPQLLAERISAFERTIAELIPALEWFIFDTNAAARNALRRRLGEEGMIRLYRLVSALSGETARQVVLAENPVLERGDAKTLHRS